METTVVSGCMQIYKERRKLENKGVKNCKQIKSIVNNK